MLRLMVLLAAVVYFSVMIAAVKGAYGWARKAGSSKASSYAAGFGGFLAVYLPVFWDQITTLIQHGVYCKRETGVWVYQTPTGWSPTDHKRTARDVQPVPQTIKEGRHIRYWTTRQLFTDAYYDDGVAHGIARREEIFQEAGTGKVIARAIDFYRGNRNALELGGGLEDLRQYFSLAIGNRECGDPSPSEAMRQLQLKFTNLRE